MHIVGDLEGFIVISQQPKSRWTSLLLMKFFYSRTSVEVLDARTSEESESGIEQVWWESTEYTQEYI